MEVIGLLFLLAAAIGVLLSVAGEARKLRRLNQQLAELRRIERYEYLKRMHEKAQP